MSHPAAPVGGRIFTRPAGFLLGLTIVAVALVIRRFDVGLGATTAMNDGYPWGLWIAFDVVTGTALASGGYAVALLVYVLNRGRYHPLVRPAILASALGYSLAAVTIIFDVGRFWNLWKLILPGKWNLHSILLEVALCVVAYTTVLWLEISPALLEKWSGATGAPARPGLRRLAAALLPVMHKALPVILAAGVLLPTMHQSSLGSVMLVTTHLHPLWHTGLLPLLFLLTCVAMGYAMVTVESHLSSLGFKTRPETAMLGGLGRIAAVLVLLYVALRLGDLGLKGRLGLVVGGDRAAVLFRVETALFLIPALAFFSARVRRSARAQFLSAMALLLAGAMYRFDTYLVAFDPGPAWSYFPSVTEILVTVGVVSFEVFAYVALVKRFPILGAAAAAPHHS